MKNLDRRDFMKYTGATAMAVIAGSRAAFAADESPAAAGSLKKAVQSGMLPESLSPVDRFKLAKACGFEAVEMNSPPALEEAPKLAEAANAAGIRIHSVVYGGWGAPFSDPDPQVIAKGLKGLEDALRGAKVMGADAVLLVPAKVNKDVRYVDAYERSQKHIRTLLPLAAELKVTIAVEFVWNDFLLSPLEFARYVDELDSPWLRAYFDTGNVVAYGYPQDWIRTLGKRIVKVHLKDFKRKEREWVNLREGDVDWKEVRKAFAEVGYTGYVTPELKGGDEAYLRDLSGRIDQIIAGA